MSVETKKYNDKILRSLSEVDEVSFLLEGAKRHKKALESNIKEVGWDLSKLKDEDVHLDAVHYDFAEELIRRIVELAELVLEERLKRKELIADMKRDLDSYSKMK